MEEVEYIKVILGFIFVVTLIVLIAFIINYFGLNEFKFANKSKKERRLEVIETLILDTKRRLLLIKRDNTEHLLLMGKDSEQIIEKDIRNEQK